MERTRVELDQGLEGFEVSLDQESRSIKIREDRQLLQKISRYISREAFLRERLGTDYEKYQHWSLDGLCLLGFISPMEAREFDNGI